MKFLGNRTVNLILVFIELSDRENPQHRCLSCLINPKFSDCFKTLFPTFIRRKLCLGSADFIDCSNKGYYASSLLFFWPNYTKIKLFAFFSIMLPFFRLWSSKTIGNKCKSKPAYFLCCCREQSLAIVARSGLTFLWESGKFPSNRLAPFYSPAYGTSASRTP